MRDRSTRFILIKERKRRLLKENDALVGKGERVNDRFATIQEQLEFNSGTV